MASLQRRLSSSTSRYLRHVEPNRSKWENFSLDLIVHFLAHFPVVSFLHPASALAKEVAFVDPYLSCVCRGLGIHWMESMPCVLSLTQNCPEVQPGDEFPVSLPSVPCTVHSQGAIVRGGSVC